MQQFFKLIIEYDGTNYHGWQVQPNGVTIQETIETALTRITSQQIRIHSSGRTDAGVHAKGQCAHFACETKLTPDIMQKALNAVLPNDIAIKACENVNADFHARFSAKSKRYRYTIWNDPVPLAIGRQYAWHVRKPLDTELMRAACDRFLGEHDFRGFESSGTPHLSTVRTVHYANIKKNSGFLHFDIEANGFLRYMVRSILGTLVEIGHAQRPLNNIDNILSTGDRKLAGATAPPHGLTLLYVLY